MEIGKKKGLNDKKASKDQFIAFVSVSFCHFSFRALIFCSLSYSWTLRVFLEPSWRSVAYLGLEREGTRKREKAQEDIGINIYCKFFLQVPSCMYGFIASFGMHGTCMWFLSYDMSLTWRIPWIDGRFSQPFHFLNIHGVVGVFPFVFQLVLTFPMVLG